jgi:hypothetical protein
VARLLVGPADGRGDELFDVTLCSPVWMATQARNEGSVDGRHHVTVNAGDFGQSALRRWLG